MKRTQSAYQGTKIRGAARVCDRADLSHRGSAGLAASGGLGRDPQVTLDHYIKRVPEALVAAMKLLEAKTTKGDHALSN